MFWLTNGLRPVGPAGAGTASFTWTVAAGGSGGNVVASGGFETGTLSSWTAAGPAHAVTTSGPHSGSYAALLGSTSPTNGSSTLAQTFTAAAGDSHLSLWYNVTCPDTVTYDWATVTLKDNTSGTTKTVLAKTCVASSSLEAADRHHHGRSLLYPHPDQPR